MEVCNITHIYEASTKFYVFMSMKPVYVDLVHRPSSGCSEVCHACQDTAIQPLRSAVTQPSL